MSLETCKKGSGRKGLVTNVFSIASVLSLSLSSQVQCCFFKPSFFFSLSLSLSLSLSSPCSLLTLLALLSLSLSLSLKHHISVVFWFLALKVQWKCQVSNLQTFVSSVANDPFQTPTTAGQYIILLPS